MGTLIKLSDVDEIFLNSDRDGVVMGICHALDRDSMATLPTRGHVPRGFLTWHDANGDDLIVNATQILSVRTADAPPRVGGPVT